MGLGWRAHAALARTRGTASVVARLSDSLYLEAGGELIWLGTDPAAMHGRAVIAGAPPERPGARARSPVGAASARAEGEQAPADLRVDATSAQVWRPRPLPGRPRVEVLAARAGAVARAVVAGLEPRGFGPLLAGRRPPFPLDRVADAAVALGTACAGGDAAAAAEAAERLVGCGPGLTPAGDDYVGGAFFARAVLLGPLAGCRSVDGPGARGAGAPDWPAALDRVRCLAASRTHRISARLLGDMVEGHAHAALHDLAHALTRARGGAGPAADAARRLLRTGHSSGWDILTGFLRTLTR